jgi:hypothetical protein
VKAADRSIQRRSGEGRLPNFIIVGAPRCGTTSLAGYLADHPDVYVAGQKEVRYFDHNYKRGASWYRAQFKGAGTRRLVGEATPNYMFDEGAIRRMAELLPDAKLIAILREPVARAYSDYWFRRGRRGDDRSFEEAIEQELRPGYTSSGHLPSALEASTYLPALERICRYYPRSSLTVMLLEELNSAPEATFGSLCDFLGIDASVKSPRLGSAVNRTYRFRSRRLHLAMLRYHLWRRLPFRLGYKLADWNSEPFTYPEMRPDTRARLRAMFADHNRDLAAWLGRDLSIWQSD